MNDSLFFIVVSSENGFSIDGPLAYYSFKTRFYENYYGDLQLLDHIPDHECGELGIFVIEGKSYTGLKYER